MGCDSSGFFSLFTGQSAQCGPVNNQIQQMRANLDQITTSLERLRSGGLGGADRDNQRRSVLTGAGAEQLRAAICQRRARPAAISWTICSATTTIQARPAPISARNPAPSAPSASAPATAPIFRSRSPPCRRRFPDDEKTCKALCPAAEATLYAYRNPGEDMNQAVSINGQPYSSSPNAFRYRQEFNPSCACKAAGQTWSDALKSIDDKAAAEQQGDIIVTEESAKKMARPPAAKAPPAAAKKGAAADGHRAGRACAGRTGRPRPLQPAPRRTTSRSARSVRPSSRRARSDPASRIGRNAAHPVERFRRSAAGARHQRLVGLGQRLAGVAKPVGDGIAAVAAEIPAASP